MNRMHPAPALSALGIIAMLLLALIVSALTIPSATFAQTAGTGQHKGGGEASLVVPDLGSVAVGGMNGRSLLLAGLVVCAFGLLFGVVIYRQMRALPVHASMRDISELIY
jgi:K(+)-stimulated pyrophosphate-energized sodium pump